MTEKNSRSLVCGVGVVGSGRFRPSTKGIHTPEYKSWINMLKRCYLYSGRPGMSAYIGCSVTPEWHNFQVFAEWITNQIGWGVSGIELDKDLLSRGGKIYSPETCVLVPKTINLMIVKKVNKNGLPEGVSWDPQRMKFKAQCSDGRGRNRFLGRYGCPNIAFAAYKSYKEAVIARVANENKSILDERAFNALIAYRI